MIRINLIDVHSIEYGVAKAWGGEGAQRTYSRNHRREWRAANREKDRAAARRWAEKFPEKAAARGRKYYEDNRDKCIEQSKTWQKEHAVQRNAYNASRRREYQKALPKWVTRQQIRDFYENVPEGMEVDHVYPLNSEWVCGLHTPDNFQFLSESENTSKTNRMSVRLHVNTPLPSTMGGYPALRCVDISMKHVKAVYKRAFYHG